jgi:hypothetical protein
MIEEFIAFLKEMQHSDDIEEIVDEVIEWMFDKDIPGNIKYNIEIGMYDFMEHSSTVKAFLGKLRPYVRKQLDTEEIQWNWGEDESDCEAITGYDDE